jgi:hypothetical protein
MTTPSLHIPGLYKKAFLLSLFTIFYNIIEGVVSMFFGYSDETLALFGFGVDSFIEVISGAGIAVMILRIRSNPESSKSRFEITALKTTRFSVLFIVSRTSGRNSHQYRYPS